MSFLYFKMVLFIYKNWATFHTKILLCKSYLKLFFFFLLKGSHTIHFKRQQDCLSSRSLLGWKLRRVCFPRSHDLELSIHKSRNNMVVFQQSLFNIPTWHPQLPTGMVIVDQTVHHNSAVTLLNRITKSK